VLFNLTVSASAQLLRRIFYKWKLLHGRMKRIKSCFVSEEQKRINSGLGYIRHCTAMHAKRRVIAMWLDFVSCSRKEELAMVWNQRKILRRAFDLYRKLANWQINFRKSGGIASNQMQQIEAFVSTIDAEKSRERFRALEKDEANKINDAEKRQTALQKQIDADILLEQQRLFTQRTY
jgi:hypothetical protein